MRPGLREGRSSRDGRPLEELASSSKPWWVLEVRAWVNLSGEHIFWQLMWADHPICVISLLTSQGLLFADYVWGRILGFTGYEPEADRPAVAPCRSRSGPVP